MKSKIQIGSMKELKHFIIAVLLIAIPIYLLSYCLRMREERFGLFGDHSKEWEGFENMFKKKKKSSGSLPLPSGVASDMTSTLDGSGEFKGSPNEDLLQQLNPKMPIHKVDKMGKKPDEKNKMLNESIKKQIMGRSKGSDSFERGGVKEVSPLRSQKTKISAGHIPPKKDEFANRISQMPQPPSDLHRSCGFYSDQCPSGYEAVSGFGIQGLPSGMTLQCGKAGSSGSSQSGKFIAEIQSGAIQSVNVIEGGSGYDKNKEYTAKTVGGGGSGASFEVIVDDKGSVQVIHVKEGGSGYTSTPQIIVQNGSGDGSSCQFCCPLS